MKMTKFNLMTKQFKDPEGYQEHIDRIEREKNPPRAAGKSAAKPVDPVPMEDQFYPLAPEYWKQSAIDLKESQVMKRQEVM